MLFSVIECGPVPTVEHSTNQNNGSTGGDSVIYKCDQGYNQTGSSILTCQINDQWSPAKPTCSGKKTILTHPLCKSVFVLQIAK